LKELLPIFMGSTIRSLGPPIQLQISGTASAQWRSWPLVDWRRWSWLVPLGIALIGEFVLWQADWILAVIVVVALIAVFWQFLTPVVYEVTPLGIRRYAFRRVRLVPWQAIRAFQLRPTGAVFFQRPNPTKVDLLSSWFVPYPHDSDEMVVAVRLYLVHAVELPA
jgi:hypothetical protein